MRVIDANDVVTEKEDISSIRLVPVDEIIDNYYPHVKFLRDEIEEFYGSKTMGNNKSKTSVNPVFAEFRRVQNCLDELGASKKSPGQKRRETSKLVGDFKAFLRTRNIRHRNLWRNLKISD